MDRNEARWIVDTIQEQREEIERLRGEIDSLRLELDAERHCHRKDNEYLVGQIERLRRDLSMSRRPYNSLWDEIERLRAALKECADELADQVEGHYAKTKDHPAMKRRYDRDMAPVLVARELLEKKA